ncbi:hypothetical protein ABT126_41945 [Streptomyces sp. NPDC002012]|uniref:hypothetical protein n=1 Tax=Streptomyces sp. NPDC002012 TaxID=3154532 RepID=UPI00331D3E1E
MRLPTDDALIRRQQDLETTLIAFADHELRRATARISGAAVPDAAVACLIRPSKRLLRMAFLHAAHTVNTDTHLQRGPI